MSINLPDKVKNLPLTPGIYLMKDSQNQILYVGKAKNLKNRVQSYFRNSKHHSPKIKKLVKHLRDFDYILTDTEFEAFMLECQLIQNMKPLYNRMMKSPQSFIYISINLTGKYRKIDIAFNPIEKDGKVYFGPFTSRSNVEGALRGLKECFKLNCSNPNGTNSACLNYSLGSCLGRCLGGPAEQQYNDILDRFIGFLKGTDRSILEDMNQMMLNASEAFDFEAASAYRDQIQTVSSLLNKEKVIEFTEESHNIVAIERLTDSTIKLFLIKRTEILFSHSYAAAGNIEDKIKTNILAYFKNDESNAAGDVSRHEIDAAHIIYRYLHSGSCSYLIIPENWLDPENHSTLDLALKNLLNNPQHFQPPIYHE
ncbi:GIY-YIG nuclease family protein [Cytobacillus oceanisediminis]|uniref:GIY-YIG nuclease family protein n=1 Tax=Cytobacillus oceanisediminis TaxID=665099 RepID=UPI00203A9D09|nr:GIY-YIG nuclease family protein [Cytobacillus oceanisediminis]MCM3530240.1 GIY-YIG nuclease family protein [Cytobacillus oceanisediminis]